MPDSQTMAVYAEVAQAYAKGAPRRKVIDQTADIAAFTARLPKQAHVLDLGCGPGHWAAFFAKRGYRVDAVDACPDMVRLTNDRHDIAAQVLDFETAPLPRHYHGIWANFSLLHAPSDTLLALLSKLRDHLHPDGVLHLGMKLGKGTSRDTLGRLFSYYSQDHLKTCLTDLGFTISHQRCGNGEGLSGGPDTFVVLTAHA